MQVEVILPLPIDKAYTYNVPAALEQKVHFGIRVEVQFGKKKIYSGIVVQVLKEAADTQKKDILDVLDDVPIINELQYKFWNWVSHYYMAYKGEVMNAALPSRLKISSESKLKRGPKLDDFDPSILSEEEYIIAEALQIREELNLSEIAQITSSYKFAKSVKNLIEEGIAVLHEELKDKYAPKVIKCFELLDHEQDASNFMAQALEKTSNSEYQTQALLAFQHLKNQGKKVFTLRDLAKTNTKIKPHSLIALEKKEIIRSYHRTMNRLDITDLSRDQKMELPPFYPYQSEAYELMVAGLEEKKICLLHGVTGSGKTRLYQELIEQKLSEGDQVLYLLPEIALTTQIIQRISAYTDHQVIVYHSRISENERVDIYRKVAQEKCFVIGARSALFLPFFDLSLVVVDEEHDSSYKQNDPSPRYHGRDAALLLANLHGAQTILGSATPSAETYFNAQEGKYAYVEMTERSGNAELPAMNIADLKKAKKQKPNEDVHFTPQLLDAIKKTLQERQQVILFQNRRGFAPRLQCSSCGWTAQCVRCDISLNYHKKHNELRCHYCGYHTKVPQACPECGFWHLDLKGVGTERIEESLSEILPEAEIQRFDADTISSKRKLEETLFRFDQREIDILVGTQMVTKGLDFDNVGLVGVLNVESLLGFPDFRATERTYQTIMQVAGRAGRKNTKGEVVLQMHNPGHPITRFLRDGASHGFYSAELHEREKFNYPPYTRLVRLTVRHKDPQRADFGAQFIYDKIKNSGGVQVFPPEVPYIAFINLWHQRNVFMKFRNHPHIRKLLKDNIRNAIIDLKRESKMSQVRVNIDVDPV